MKLDNLRKPYVEQLKDLYSAENQILEALPKMEKAVGDQKLASLFRSHRKQTEGHVQRLEQIFAELEFEPGGKKCKGVEGLIKEGEELIEEGPDQEVLDAGLIAAAQRVEHYEMAGYGTARAYAKLLGYDDAVRILSQTLDEESSTDENLTAMAESRINERALA